MAHMVTWFRSPLWRVPRWVWLAAVLLALVGWILSALPKPAPRAAATVALPLALAGTPIPQPSAACA